MNPRLARAEKFAQRFGLHVPILLAPMAGVPAPALSVAVMKAGGMGACGVLLMSPEEIATWCAAVRAKSDGPLHLNLWVPDPPPRRDADHEARVRTFLGGFGPEVPASAGDTPLRDFNAQCDAMLLARPAVISSVMGIFPPSYVARLKAEGIAWAAGVSTVADALTAAKAGADMIVAQGAEAGGHRAAFDAGTAEHELVGLFSLLPAIVDAVDVPVVATGGITDARGLAAALMLGASAVQIGTGFLRAPETGLNRAWADGLALTLPEQTRVSRVFSGRPGRSIANAYVRAATSAEAPQPAPYPIQRALTQAMRESANKAADLEKMQAWAGQSARLARAAPAGKIVTELWDGAKALLA